MESAVPQVAAAELTVEKPASQPYYKSPTEIDASWLVFEKKPDRAVKVAGVKTTTFSVGMKPPSTGAPVAVAVAAPEAGRGGRGGRGRGGRGGRGSVQKLGSLAIKPSTSMRTKYGINVSVPTVGGEKDMTLVNYLKEHPRHINALAAGMIPTPPGVHFEIIVFLDPTDPEHQRLEELSNEARDSFEAYVWECGIPLKADHRVNGFVRVSDKTEERYIVLMMSTMHTVDAAKFFPTPFYDQKNQIVLWDALVNHSFRAEWDFKVNHVITVNGEKSTFKSYVSSCKLVEEPKVSLSERQLQQEEFLQQMKIAGKSAIASAVANGEDALPKSLSTVARATTEVNEDDAAASLAALTAGAAPLAKPKKPKTVVRAPKVKKAPSPPPVEEDEEAEGPEEEPLVSDAEEAQKTPVPQSVMKKLSSRAVA